MKTYLSAFITGFSKVVNEALEAVFPDVQIQLLDDGIVIYKTSSPLEEVMSLKFLNNTYILIRQLNDLDPNSPNTFIKQIIRDHEFDKLVSTTIPQNKATFRVIVTKENEAIKIHSEILKKIEDKISQASNWKVGRANPGLEQTLKKFPNLQLVSKYNTLVSGQKASIYKITKH